MVTDDNSHIERERGETWYSFGHRHLEQQNMSEAAKCFIRSTKQDLGSKASAYQWAGMALGKLGRPEQALRYLDKSLELEVDNEFRAQSHFGRALVLNDLGRNGDAIEACISAYSLDRYDPTFVHLLSMFMNEDVFVTFGEKKSKPQVQAESSPRDETLARLVHDLSEYFVSGKIEQARILVERLSEEYPEHVLTKGAKANLLERDGHYEEASEIYAELSSHYLAKMDHKMSMDAARIAIKLAPTSPAAWLAYGRILANRERDRDAEKAFKRGLRRKRDNPYLAPIYLELGKLYYKQGNLDTAENMLRESIDADSRAEAWRLLGITFLLQKKYLEGKETLEEADVLNERTDAKVFLALGLAHFLLGEKEACKERLQETFEVYSRGQKHLLKYANRRLGHILRGSRNSPDSWIILLETLEILQAAYALPIAARIAANEVNTSGKIWYYVYLTADKGEKDTALMRAVELEPDDPKIKLAHIISFYDDGLVEEAYRMFCEIPDEHPARDKADKWIAKLEEEFQENEMLEPYDDYYDGW